MRSMMLTTLAGWGIALATLATLPVSASAACPGDEKKPSLTCPGDEKKPSACPGDEKKPSSCPDGDKKPSAF